MSTHNDKVPDKLVSSSSHKPSREKHSVNRSGLDNKQQEKKFAARQDQKHDNKYKNRQPKKIEKEQEEKPVVTEHKVDNRYSLGQDHMQDNRNDVNRTNEGQVLRPDSTFTLYPDGRNSVSVEEDGNQQRKDDRKEKKDENKGNEVVSSDAVNNESREEVLSVQPEERTEGGNAEAVVKDVDNLPSTAILLTTKGGSKVYVVGTVHFSVESQQDVAEVIRAVQPDYLVIELCLSRAYMLQWNEEHILREAQQMNFKAMKRVIQSAGLVQGGLYLLMLSLTIQITKQLGIAPGGEFRTAYREAMSIPNCVVWFGDRPLEITLHRMLASLSIWQMTKLLFVILFKNEKIRTVVITLAGGQGYANPSLILLRDGSFEEVETVKEEVENCKNSDVLERMMLSISKELPDFANVVLNERDLFLAYSLQVAAERSEPNKVVGVVGIGHLAGIKKNWGKVTAEDVQKILAIPPPRRSARIIKFAFKFAAVGLVVYGVHKLASKSTTYTNLFSDQSYWNLSNMMYDIWDSPIIQT